MTDDIARIVAAIIRKLDAGELRALSIKQPYPHNIFHDGKDVENRDWRTNGRGWFLIHAGLSKSELDMEDPTEAALPRGGIVGFARITDCVNQMDSPWFFGRHGFVLADATPLRLIPCKGALGFFNPGTEVLAQVRAALQERGL